jgi:lipoprotein-anchoring transpeptidase ErfK/SrfK
MAQFQPPPYSTPPGAYGGVPDENGVIAARQPRAAAPYDQGSAPYPYDNPARTESGTSAMPGEVSGNALPPLTGNAYQSATPNAQPMPQSADPYPIPNYDAPPATATAPASPYGHYGDRPAADPQGRMQPPAGIPSAPGSIAAPESQPAPSRPNTVAALPPEDQPETGQPAELPPQFKRQVVPYQTKEPAGTIIVDTPSTYLYYVQGDGTAIRYGIGVGREGFTWAGREKISRKAEWPDWHPPAEMIDRQPYLPRFMAGGEGNPLGARALYLGSTIYRIHGTNQPSTIGKFVSSGCIRMLNDDVIDLYNRVKVGTRVVVRPGGPPPSVTSSAAPVTR